MNHPAILVAAIRFAGVDLELGRIVDSHPVRTVRTGGQP